jgi:hypothetical protein
MALFRVFAIVLIAVLAFGYAAMFVSWNATTTTVVGLNTPWTNKLVEDLPVWSLPFIGGVIGIFAMLFSAWALWSGQKRQADKYKRQVDKAKRIIAERNRTIEDQQQRIDELEAGAPGAQDSAAEVGTEVAGDAEGEPLAEPEPKQADGDDDDEVI